MNELNKVSRRNMQRVTSLHNLFKMSCLDEFRVMQLYVMV